MLYLFRYTRVPFRNPVCRDHHRRYELAEIGTKPCPAREFAIADGAGFYLIGAGLDGHTSLSVLRGR
jgi:hypothetical protein